MNVYEKIQEAKFLLLQKNLEKTGINSYSGYKYFELGDFMPPLIAILKDLKLYSAVSYTEDTAVLTIINAEAPDEKIVFTSPMREASLRGAHPIQNLGAVETYQRRYLYMAAFDIVDSDTVDSIQGKPQPPAQPPSQPSPQTQYICHDCGKPFVGFTSAKGRTFSAGQVYHLAQNSAEDKIARCSSCLKKSGKEKNKGEQKNGAI